MPQMNFDLEDGKPPVSFSLWPDDCERFVAFMAECEAERKDAARYRSERENLAMMIRMLVSSLKRYWPHAPQPFDLPSKAVDLLMRYGLIGSALQEDGDAAIDAAMSGKD